MNLYKLKTKSKNGCKTMNSKILKTNYHTHTTFCDGNNSAEEMVIAAIERKFDILGFSGHSMFPFGELWHIAPKEHTEYVKTIRQLENKYKDKIIILCGFEADFIPSFCEPSFSRFEQFQPDYLIGSVHYVANEKGFVTVDESPEGVKLGIDRLFNGNSKKFVQEYFYLERLMLTNGCFTILGHADLIRKRNGILNFFNEQDYWYRKEIKLLANEIKKSGVIVEINTGAISRGAMDDVYPSQYFLELLHERNVPVTISSDAHSCTSIDTAFDRAVKAALQAGFREQAVLLPKDSSNQQKAIIAMQPLV